MWFKAISLATITVGLTGSLALAAPTLARADDGPCDLAQATFLCHFMPMEPELDEDVDLSTQVPPASVDAVLPDTPPADVCAVGCR
jgi:hypothetical protein